MVIHPHHDIERALCLYWSRDHYLANAALEVGFQSIRRDQFAAAFEDDVDAACLPRHLVRLRAIRKSHSAAIHGEVVGRYGRWPGPAPVNAVELEKVGRRRRTALDFVDMND